MQVTALAREKHYAFPRTLDEVWVPYRGKYKEYLLTANPSTRIACENDTDLWMLEFKRMVQSDSNMKWALACGCVFDIDTSGPLQTQVLGATLAKDRDALLRICAELVDIIANELGDLSYRIFASGSKGLHVYVKNPAGFLLVDNPSKFTPRLITSFLEARFSQQFLALIDKSPYAHKKGIRPVHCIHPTTKIQPFIIYDRRWPESDEDSFLYWVTEYLSVPDNWQADTIEIDPAPITVRATIQYHNAIPEVLEQVADTDLSEWILSKCGHSQIFRSGKYFRYGEGNSTWCPMAQLVHPTNCVWWQTLTNGTSIASCFDAVCSGKRFVYRSRRDHIQPLEIEGTQENILLDSSTSNSRYLPTARFMEIMQNPARKAVFWEAPLGSGKSYNLYLWIETLVNSNPDVRVIFCGARIQQLKAFYARFQTLGFVDYEQWHGSLYDVNRVLVCLNSLTRLFGPKNPQSKFAPLPIPDILIFDEWDFTVRCLLSGLVEEAPIIFEIIQLLLRQSVKIICLDGLPTDMSARFLQEAGVLSKFTWVRFQSFHFKRWLFVNHTVYFTESLLGALKAGRNIFLVTNSKKAIFRIVDLAIKFGGLAREEILAIHGDMNRTTRDNYGDPATWTRFRMVCANGSLGPGASFEQLHFHQVFCLVLVHSVLAVDIAQLVERVRRPIREEVIVMVLKKPSSNSLDPGAIPTFEEFKAKRNKVIGTYVARAFPAWVTITEPSRVRNAIEVNPLYPPQVYNHLRTATTISESSSSGNQTRVVPIPVYDDLSGDLVHELRSCQFGLVFEEPPLLQLQARLDYLQAIETEDSELFLAKLKTLCLRSGADYTEIGERTIIDDETGQDKVLGFHMSYLKTLKKMVTDSQTEDTTDSHHCEGDLLFNQVASILDPDKLKVVKQLLYDSAIGNTRLFRLQNLLKYFNSDTAQECINDALDRETQRYFQVDAAENHSTLGASIDSSAIARKALNNIVTSGEVMLLIHNILSLTNFKISHGKFIGGQFTSSIFFTHPEGDAYRKKWWEAVRAAATRFQTIGYAHTFKTKVLLRTDFVAMNALSDPCELHSIVFSHMVEILDFVGLPLERVAVRRSTKLSPGKKVAYHVLGIDMPRFYAETSILGLDTEGNYIGAKDAFTQYFATHTVDSLQARMKQRHSGDRRPRPFARTFNRSNN